MNGMIFAAGLGTRLQPLTNDRPKALVEVAGKPLLEYVMRKMIAADAAYVVSVHHYADQIKLFCANDISIGIS
ncbi:MAG: sugar phosphate nucleotidyltransferase [Odoribacter splanchnicus]